MKKLILLNLINWYVTSKSQWFLNSRDIVKLCKVNFWLFIECNTDSCFERKTGGINIYLYGYVVLLAPVCTVCLFLFVWYQIRVLAKSQVRPQKTKTFLHKTHHEVLVVLGTRLSMCRSIMSLSKITHQIWVVALLDAGVGGVVGTLKKFGKGTVSNVVGRAWG